MRIRTIKPEFFTHERLFDTERETGLPIRVAFAGLLCACDREGRFKWEPRRLGIAILPYDEVDFGRVLHALVTRAFIVKYRVGDEWFGAIPSWNRHQVVNNREAASNIPDIADAEEVDACSTRESRVDHASKEEGKGKEGKGKESSAPAVAAGQQELLGTGEAEPTPERDTRHRDITSRWGGLFEGTFGVAYQFAGKDAASLKRFLGTVGDSADEIMATATRAWERTKQDRFSKRCKEAATIHGLCTFYNEIRVELQTPNSHGTAHRTGNSRGFSQSGSYAGVTDKG